MWMMMVQNCDVRPGNNSFVKNKNPYESKLTKWLVIKMLLWAKYVWD
jgi:hypothetical protein